MSLTCLSFNSPVVFKKRQQSYRLFDNTAILLFPFPLLLEWSDTWLRCVSLYHEIGDSWSWQLQIGYHRTQWWMLLDCPHDDSWMSSWSHTASWAALGNSQSNILCLSCRQGNTSLLLASRAHRTGPPTRLKTYPDVNLRSWLSPAQSASQ